MDSSLKIFSERSSPAYRKRRRIFVCLWMGVTALLVWPLYPWLGAASEPRILGLPLSFAWVIGALLSMFVFSLWLFLSDEKEASRQGGD